MSIIHKIQPAKPSSIIIFLVLCLLSVGISFVIAMGGLKIGMLLISAIVGIPMVALLLTNSRFGFFLILVASFFIAYIQRISDGAIPVAVLEIMMLLVTAGLIMKKIRSHATADSNWKDLRNPITIAVLLYTVYIHLQLLNPSSTAPLGTLVAIRFSWYNLLGFIIALQIFDNVNAVKTFFKIILGVGFVAALYGLSQKYIGLLPYEHEWMFSSPERMSLGVIWGELRAWSFLNDPSNFGMLMAFCGLLCFTLILGPYKTKSKIVLAICGLSMFLAMVASGTRTAFVMVAVGFTMFGLLTISSLRTIVFSLVVLVVLLGIYFGPFYSSPVQRIRSAFKGNEDASMNVRSENRSKIQPYIQSHPIGGSPGSTGEVGKEIAPGHPLAGFPPDSGYLKVALEMGYIGLAALLWMYSRASSQALRYYFRCTNPESKIFYAAIISSFIALCVANLTQLATEMRPFDFFIFSYFAIIMRLRSFDEEEFKNS